MNPTRTSLEELLSRREGNLADTPFALLLLAIASAERSVLLELRRGVLEKQVIFDAGSPVDCRSNVATETLGRFLVSIGRLSERDYTATLSAAAARGLSLEEVLTERQLITPSDLFRVLQQNLGRKLLDAFNWRSGTYHISNDVPLVDSPLRVKVPQLILTGVVKFEAQETVDAAVSELGARQLILADSPPIPLDEFRLSSEQSAIVAQIARGATVDALRNNALAPEELNRFLYLLLLVGAVDSREAPQAAERVPFISLELDLPPEPVAPPPPANPAPEPMPAAVAAEPAKPRPRVSADDLLRLYISFRRKDAFELLELSEDATTVAIIRAYVKLAEMVQPSNFTEGDSDGLREKAQEIFLAAARAYAELADPDRRAALVARRSKKREEPPPPPQAETVAPKPTVIDPEALYRNGRELSDAKKYREALSYFEMAADCDAQNGTYAAELVWCRYQLLLSPAATALKALKNAMRIDPRAGTAYLYTGNIHATLGNKLEAEGYLRKAMSLMPRDRRPADALKALMTR